MTKIQKTKKIRSFIRVCKNDVHKKFVELPKYKICAAFPKNIILYELGWKRFSHWEDGREIGQKEGEKKMKKQFNTYEIF